MIFGILSRGIALTACAVTFLAAHGPAQSTAEHETHAAHAHQAAVREVPWSTEIVELAESLPVQDGGRIKPLHTYAGFTLLRMNGKRSLTTPGGERLTPVEWLLDVLFFPELSATYPMFLVQNADVVDAMGLSIDGKKRRDRYSYDELRPGIERLFQLAGQYHGIDQKARSAVQEQVVLLATNIDSYIQLNRHMDFARYPIPIRAESELAGLFDGRTEVSFSEVVAHMGAILELRDKSTRDRNDAELGALSEVLMAASELTGTTDSLSLLPAAAAAPAKAPWSTPSDVFFKAFRDGELLPEHVGMLASFESLARERSDPVAFERDLTALQGSVTALAERRGEYHKVGLELSYYKAKLLDYSQYLFVLSFLLMAFMWLRPRSKVLHATTTVAVLVPTLLLSGAIVMRCVIRGRPPVSTLYETVLFVTAVGALVAMFVEAANRRKIAISAAAILGTIGLFIANGYEMMDKRDTMPSLVAVLDTNFWLATHVTSITIGYSAGILAALLASVYLLAKLVGWKRSDRSFYKSTAKMVYGVLCFSVIFSVVGTILGGIWANDSWGRFWGWDPKENGALLIVLSQLIILHGRMGGYLREHGVCMATAFAGTVVAFSWWGVNLLGVGLHSYGFTSGIARALWIYYGIQWGIVGLGGVAWLLERARSTAAARASVTSTERSKSLRTEVSGA